MTDPAQEAAILAAHHATEPLLVADSEQVIFANQAFADLVGVAVDRVVGSGIDQIISILHEPMVLERLRNALRQHQPFRGEAAFLSADGDAVPVALTVIPTQTGGGEWFVASGLDLRHQKRLERQLRQSQRLDAVTQLADGISHEMNEAIQIITGFADLTAKGSATPLTRVDLTTIDRASRRAASLLSELLEFARPRSPTRQTLDLTAIVSHWQPLLQVLIGTQIDLVVELEEGTAPVFGDRTELQQVLINLVTNGRDAMPNGGVLTIRTHSVSPDQALDAGDIDERLGAFVVLTVSDTGVGMTTETKAQLFEPFFTTKGDDGTRGLGLATIQDIVRESGGLLWVRTREGQGTSVEVHFPALPEQTQEPRPVDLRPSPGDGTETILLVDDDPGVVIVARRGLEHFGYTVLSASGGAEAIAIATERGAEIALVVTDVMMPGQRGTGLAQDLMNRWPALKVLFISGYPGEEAAEMVNRGRHLMKPFTPDELARAVRSVLDG